MWNFGPWGGNCEMRIQPDGEIWMVRNDGRDTDGYRVWKTQNGDGPRMVNKFNTKISIFWDN